MTKLESIKTKLKGVIPWQLRYHMKLFEAVHPSFHLPMKFNQDVSHYNEVLYEYLERIGGVDAVNGKTVCELGPGQFLTHAALLYQLGAENTYLLDIDDLAKSTESKVKTKDIRLKDSSARKCKLPRLQEDETWSTYIKKVGGIYQTDGLNGYKKIPDNSVDFVISDAVFEHIRKKIFVESISEMYRFSRCGGISCHIVDLRDHFGGGKNQLRFSEETWEDEAHYRMDNYTNRLSCKEICEICENVGFQIMKLERSLYEKMPIKRAELDVRFNDMDDTELMTAAFMIMMKK